MKQRSTVICARDGRILLVARERALWPSRWSLPGGKIKLSETPLEACRRELNEETSIDPQRIDYLFQFGGLAKRHHVFFVELAQDVAPRPCHEIAECRWFSPDEIAVLPASIPTHAIIGLFTTWHSVQLMPGEPSL